LGWQSRPRCCRPGRLPPGRLPGLFLRQSSGLSPSQLHPPGMQKGPRLLLPLSRARTSLGLGEAGSGLECSSRSRARPYKLLPPPLGWRQRDPAGNDPNRSRDDRQKLYHPRRSKGAKGPYWDDPKRAGTARLGRCHFLSLSIARLKLLPLWLPPGGVKGPSRDDPGTPLINLWEEGQGTTQRRAAPPASAKCSS